MTLKLTDVWMKDQIAIQEMIENNAGITAPQLRSFYPHFKLKNFRKRYGLKIVKSVKCSKGHEHIYMVTSNSKWHKRFWDDHSKSVLKRNKTFQNSIFS